MPHRDQIFSGLPGAQASIFDFVLDVIGEGVVVVDGAGQYVVFNAAAREALGSRAMKLAPAEWAERLKIFAPEGLDPMPADRLPIVRALAGESVDWTEMILRPDEGVPSKALLMTARPIPGGPGERAGAVAVLRDITDFRQRVSDLMTEAAFDELTGLFNRRYLMNQFMTVVGAAHRQGAEISLCICDIDLFKSVNDTHGHRAGDEVLRAFARVLRQHVRDQDIVGRYGGDEMIVIFPGAVAETAAKALERIRAEFCRLEFVGKDGETFHSSASFGVADVRPWHTSPLAALGTADKALYQAKALGRNRVEICRDRA